MTNYSILQPVSPAGTSSLLQTRQLQQLIRCARRIQLIFFKKGQAEMLYAASAKVHASRGGMQKGKVS